MIIIRKIFYVLKSSTTDDVIISSVNQLFRLISGPLMLVTIPLFLKSEIQGYWYTFGSISALSMLADLGFTTIILQFSAHEFAHLKMNAQMNLEGPQEYIDRLSTLFRFVMQWTCMLIGIAFPLIFLVGWSIFTGKGDKSIWLLPWSIFISASSLGFINSIVSSFVTGCDQVANIQKRLLVSSITQVVVTLSALYLGAGLYAIGIASIVGNILSSTLLITQYNTLFKTLLMKVTIPYKWGKEIFKLLWKYAVSWSSGYMIFQIYTPFMFIYHGPIEAGKVGISISLVTAMFSISNIWISANTPRFNMLVSQKDWHQLDRQFWKNLTLSILTFIFEVLVLFIIVYALSGRWILFDRISSRFASFLALSMLIIGWFLEIVINGFATYMRAHKQEPIVTLSVVSGLFIVITTYFSARFLPADLFFLGFLLSFLFALPWTIWIFHKNRISWHK